MLAVRNVVSLIKLIRLHNCLMAAVGVWLGGRLADAEAGDINVLLASIAAALVCASGNSLNDLLDVEIDRLNHPQRPLPKGELPLYMALLAVFIFSILALAAAIAVSWKIFLIVAGSIMLLFWYNFSLKKMPLAGNMAISLLGGVTFLVGGLAVDASELLSPPGPVVPAVFAVLFHFGRELIKDLSDFKGDKQADFKTLPSIISPKYVLVITNIVFLILMILTLLPIYFKWYGLAYSYITVLAVDIPLIISLLYLWISRSESRFANAASYFKLLMVFGLLAFFLAKN